MKIAWKLAGGSSYGRFELPGVDCIKNHDNLSLGCCVYISLSDLIRVLKAVAIATSEHLNLLTIFVVSHFLTATNCVL